MTHTHDQLTSIEAATTAGVFDTDAFLDFANQDCYQALFTEADLDAGAQYEEARQPYIDKLWQEM